MFSSKCEVDDHVKKLLAISKHQPDIIKQYHTIAKMYYDINEFKVAKQYIDEFTKYQTGNEYAWDLKGKIYEKLGEIDGALKCYENLYLMNKTIANSDNITRMLRTIPNVSESKINHWKTIFQKDFKEINKEVIVSKLVHNTKELDLFIKSLMGKDETAIFNCVDLLNTVPNLDFSNVKCILKIFREHKKSITEENKDYFIIILLKYLKFYSKIDEVEYERSLFELLKLLSSYDLENIYKEFVSQFLYFVGCFADSRLLNKSDKKISRNSILQCYNQACQVDYKERMNDHLSKWIDQERRYRLSVCSHVLQKSNDKNHSNFSQFYEDISELVWGIGNDKYEAQTILSTLITYQHLEINFKDCMDKDKFCLDSLSNNLILIEFQINNYFVDNELSDQCCNLISHIANNIFQKLEGICQPKSSILSISKVDIITFLLGSLITFRKMIKSHENLPVDIFDNYINVNFSSYRFDNCKTWWTAVCDYILGSRKQTSVGYLREFLRKGLDALQLTENFLSDNVKLVLGKYLYQYAEFIPVNRDNCLTRVYEFYSSVLVNKKISSSLKMLPMFSAKNQKANFSNNNSKNTEFSIFDCDEIDESEWDKVRRDAYKFILDTQINCEPKEQLSPEKIEDIFEYLFSKNIGDVAELLLLKTKHHFKQSEKCRNAQGEIIHNSKYNHHITRARECAEKGIQKTNDKTLIEHFMGYIEEIDQTCQKQINYSIFDYSISSDTSNFNQKFINNDGGSSSRAGKSDQMLANSIKSEKLDEIESQMGRLNMEDENLQICITQCSDKLNKLFTVVQSQQLEINRLTKLSKRQNQWNNDLLLKVDHLKNENYQLKQLEYKYDHFIDLYEDQNVRIGYMQQNIRDIHTDLANLDRKINYINLKEEQNQYLNELDKKIDPITNKVLDNVQNQCNTVCSTINELHMKKMMRNYLKNVPFEKKNGSRKIINSKKYTNCIDLSKLNEGKWQCEVCLCNNENRLSVCPACQTANPKADNLDKSVGTKKEDSTVKFEFGYCSESNKVEEVSKPNFLFGYNQSIITDTFVPKTTSTGLIDLSKLNEGKWQCEVCLCNNENNLTVCPACQTAKTSDKPLTGQNIEQKQPTDNKFRFGYCSESNKVEEVSKPNFLFGYKQPTITDTFVPKTTSTGLIDLSKLNEGKWQCEVCLCSNDNSLNVCPACQTANPKAYNLDKSVGNKKEDSTVKFEFGSSKLLNVNKPVFPEASTINDKVDIKSDFEESCQLKDMNLLSLLSIDSESEVTWSCDECTTVNKNSDLQCIACSKLRIESTVSKSTDSDVEIVSEPYVTPDQIKKALELQLPYYFYSYKNKPEYTCSDSEDESDENDNKNRSVERRELNLESNKDTIDEITTQNCDMKSFNFSFDNSISSNSKQTEPFKLDSFNFDKTPMFSFPLSNGGTDSASSLFSFTLNKSVTNSIQQQEEHEEDHVESINDQDIHFEPIVKLEKVQLNTGEEGYTEVFNQRAKLFAYVNNEWKERCLGNVRVLVSDDLTKGPKGRLVMRQEVTGYLRLNQSVTESIPKFQSHSKPNTLCWFSVDFSKGEEEKVMMLIKFKNEDLVVQFESKVKLIQENR